MRMEQSSLKHHSENTVETNQCKRASWNGNRAEQEWRGVKMAYSGTK